MGVAVDNRLDQLIAERSYCFKEFFAILLGVSGVMSRRSIMQMHVVHVGLTNTHSHQLQGAAPYLLPIAFATI